MAKFEINGITLRVPARCMNAELEKALQSGRYESLESGALQRHAKAGDRLLDLGAGAGYVSALAAQIVGGASVVAVEASTDMLEILRKNLDANGARDARVVHGAVVPDDHVGASVAFAMRPAFWASSIATGNVPQHIVHEMPALRLGDLLAEHRPSIVMMDVEGAEVALCRQPWPSHVRLLILEIHTKRYPPQDVRALFDGLSRNDFAYMPFGSQGEVLIFQRICSET